MECNNKRYSFSRIFPCFVFPITRFIYSLTIFLGIHPFQMLSFFTNEEPDYILSIFLCALDEKTGSVNTDGDPSLT